MASRPGACLPRTPRRGEGGLLDRLSPRELEGARRVALGMPNRLVGRELAISEKTVHVHRQHVMEKTGVGSAVELAPVRACRRSYIETTAFPKPL